MRPAPLMPILRTITVLEMPDAGARPRATNMYKRSKQMKMKRAPNSEGPSITSLGRSSPPDSGVKEVRLTLPYLTVLTTHNTVRSITKKAGGAGCRVCVGVGALYLVRLARGDGKDEILSYSLFAWQRLLSRRHDRDRLARGAQGVCVCCVHVLCVCALCAVCVCAV